jgi:hypothetical protein
VTKRNISLVFSGELHNGHILLLAEERGRLGIFDVCFYGKPLPKTFALDSRTS